MYLFIGLCVSIMGGLLLHYLPPELLGAGAPAPRELVVGAATFLFAALLLLDIARSHFIRARASEPEPSPAAPHLKPAIWPCDQGRCAFFLECSAYRSGQPLRPRYEPAGALARADLCTRRCPHAAELHRILIDPIVDSVLQRR